MPEAFDLSDDISVGVGTYEFYQLSGFAGTPFQNFLGAIFNFTVGGFYGADFLSVGVSPRWRLNKHLRFDGTYQYNRADFKEREQIFNSHLGRLKAEYLFNTKVSLAAFLQYNSVDELYSSNVRFRYNPREGVDLFIVYNDNINTERQRELPFLPASNERTFLIKYSYTFRGK